MGADLSPITPARPSGMCGGDLLGEPLMVRVIVDCTCASCAGVSIGSYGAPDGLARQCTRPCLSSAYNWTI
jgi:hypothetical protein